MPKQQKQKKKLKWNLEIFDEEKQECIMTILRELMEYADRCLHDVRVSEYEDYISGIKHKWACRRFLEDVKKYEARNTIAKSWPFVWVEEEAQKIVDWFLYLRHSKGTLSGQPIALTPWQKFVLCQIYGWRQAADGRKRFKQSFIEVGRKNAKSQMEAGVALYEISVGATKNGEVYEYYTAGVKRDQSKIIVNEAKLMLKGSPLRKKFKITRDLIEHIKTGSFIKPLSREDGQEGDGTNPAGLILDEYHQHRTTEFYDLGLGSNTKEPLLMIITTAGTDLSYPCYTQEYTYCSRLLDPDVDVENEAYFADILELDATDYQSLDNIANERLWWKANPIRMSYEDGRDKIQRAYKVAKEIPEKLIAFLTKVLNVWVQAKTNAYMDMAKWKACEVETLPIDLTGRPVYVGFDMSAKTDLTSVAFVVPYQSGVYDKNDNEVIRYVLWTHSFIPNREKLREHIVKDKVPYDYWEQAGFLTVTETPIVDQGQVMRYVQEECAKYSLDIQCLCFDPANASKLMMDLSNEGYDVEEVFQSHKSLNESTQGFREQVFCGNVAYLYNALLNYAMSNAVVRQQQGLIKIDKDATTKRVDPVDAALCAFKLAMYHVFTDGYLLGIDEFLENEE